MHCQCVQVGITRCLVVSVEAPSFWTVMSADYVGVSDIVTHLVVDDGYGFEHSLGDYRWLLAIDSNGERE